jgi:hypothetical protein
VDGEFRRRLLFGGFGRCLLSLRFVRKAPRRLRIAVDRFGRGCRLSLGFGWKVPGRLSITVDRFDNTSGEFRRGCRVSLEFGWKVPRRDIRVARFDRKLPNLRGRLGWAQRRTGRNGNSVGNFAVRGGFG